MDTLTKTNTDPYDKPTLPLHVVTNKVTYKTYRKYCERKGIEPFKLNEYALILKLYGEYGGEQLLLGHKIELGGAMGSLYIERRKVTSKKNINWKESVYNEQGKMVEKVYYNNPWRYFFHWTKPMKGGKAMRGMYFTPTKGKRDKVYNWRRRLSLILEKSPLEFKRYKTYQKIKSISGFLNGQKVVKVKYWLELHTIFGYTHSQVKTIKACAYGDKAKAYDYTWEIEYEVF